MLQTQTLLNRADLLDKFCSQLQMSSGDLIAYRTDHGLLKKKEKPIIMISTSFSAAVTTVTSRNHHARPQVKPVVVDSYNHHMNGVDIADQYVVYYSFMRKTVKWWQKVDFWLFETAMVNPYFFTLRLPTHQCLALPFADQ